MQLVHDQMFRSAVLRHRREPGWEQFEAGAFARLREMIVHEAQLSPACPRRNVMEDQIVWARSPIRLRPGRRLDRHAALLHRARRQGAERGRRPQRPAAHPGLCQALASARNWSCARLTSGVEERVRTYAELDTFAPARQPVRAGQGRVRAGRASCRASTRDGGFASLEQQLREFGGGIEISLLAAVPKGSGLGTSSILAATVLAALGDLCGLDWDRNVLFTRTLALEQMLTTGGGWQDQAGAHLPRHQADRDRARPGAETRHRAGCRITSSTTNTPTARSCSTTPASRAWRRTSSPEIVRGIFLNSPVAPGTSSPTSEGRQDD